MKHFFSRVIAVIIMIPILFSVCFPSKRAYDFSKEKQKISTCLFADDNEPKPKNQA